MKKGFFAIFTLILTACSSIPSSYLSTDDKPIVNIEAPADKLVDISAKSEMFTLTNITEHALRLYYMLIWYDQSGVTQTESRHTALLQPYQQLKIALTKPSSDSLRYRVYLRRQ